GHATGLARMVARARQGRALASPSNAAVVDGVELSCRLGQLLTFGKSRVEAKQVRPAVEPRANTTRRARSVESVEVDVDARQRVEIAVRLRLHAAATKLEVAWREDGSAGVVDIHRRHAR